MNTKQLSIAAVAALLAAPAFAADEAGPKFNFSGFGTVGISRQNNDSADFVRSGQPEKSTFGLDSNLGLQANVDFNPMFSAVAQVLARRDNTPEYKAKVEWAFAKAKLTQGVSIRAGRMALPAYLISDSRNVGYANIAIRPPIEVYGQVPMSTLDGADITLQKDFGDVTVTGQIAYGKLHVDYPSGIKVEAPNTVTANISAETGPFVFRLAHVRNKLTITGSASLDGLLASVAKAGYSSIADSLAANHKDSHFTGLGMTMDYKNFLVQTEYTQVVTDSYVSDRTAKYLMVGYRVGDFVPYASYATSKTDSATVSAIPHTGPLLPLALGVDSVMSGNDQSSSAIGIRWNFAKSASLKVQADFVKPDGTTKGYLANVKSASYHGERVRVLAAAVDFVF